MVVRFPSILSYGVCLLLALAVGAAASAQELRLGATAQYAYNSNFFNAANDPDSANSFQIGPNVAILDSEGRFRYDATYNGDYEFYVDQDGVDAWESRLRVRGAYDLDRRTSIEIQNRFRDISNLRFSRQDIELGDGSLDPTQDQFYRNDFEVALIRSLSRRTDATIRVGHHWVDFDKNVDRNDSQAVEVGSQLDYQLATDHSVGAGVSYIYQDVERALSRLGSQGDYVNSYVTWTWDVMERIQFSMNGGPSWIRSEENSTNQISQTQFVGGKINGETNRAPFTSCDAELVNGILVPVASRCDFRGGGIPAADLGGVQSFALTTGERVSHASEVTFFGGASLLASFAEWNLQTIYSRRQATTSGDSLASSLDEVIVNLEYAPPKYRWSTYVAFSFDRRETLTEGTEVDFVVVSGTDGAAERAIAFTQVESSRRRRDNFFAITGVRYAMSRYWSGNLEFRYRRTQTRDRGITQPDTDTFLLLFSIDYDYDPIHF